MQAILTNEMRIQEIELNTTFGDLNGSGNPVQDATIVVAAGGATYRFDHNPTTPGQYLSQFPFAVVSQLRYDLVLEWESELYSASSILSEVAPIPEIRFDQVDTLGHFTISDYTKDSLLSLLGR
jgi:hypothetical protein